MYHLLSGMSHSHYMETQLQAHSVFPHGYVTSMSIQLPNVHLSTCSDCSSKHDLTRNVKDKSRSGDEGKPDKHYAVPGYPFLF